MECLILQNEERVKQLQTWEMNEEIQIFREYLRFPTVHPNIDYRRSFALKFRSSPATSPLSTVSYHTIFVSMVYYFYPIISDIRFLLKYLKIRHKHLLIFRWWSFHSYFHCQQFIRSVCLTTNCFFLFLSLSLTNRTMRSISKTVGRRFGSACSDRMSSYTNEADYHPIVDWNAARTEVDHPQLSYGCGASFWRVLDS